jgi:hypothetical protein
MTSLSLIRRVPDWDRRLARVTEKHIALPGEWGVADCGLTASDVALAVIGNDFLGVFRGRYSAELGAARIMRKQGWETMEDVLAAHFDRMPRLHARRGDLVIVERAGALSAGYICEHGAAVKSERGLSFVPQTEIRSAWKVGK